MAARLGALAIVTFLMIGCTTAQATPSATGGLSPSPPTATPTTIASTSASPSLTPSASPTSEATASPSPTPSVGTALAWQHLGQVKGSADAYRSLVGFAGGYVALGDASVLYSTDGRSWASVALPFHHAKDEHGIALEDYARSIATDGTTVVVVGGYGHVPCTPSTGAGGGPECPSSPISWVSRDGKTWRSSYPWGGPGAPKPYHQGLEFSTVWAVPDGGWDAATDYVAGEASGAGTIFHSTDGLAWTALASAPPRELKESPAAPPTESWGPAAADRAGRRLVAGTWYVQQGDGAMIVTHLFTSIDGKVWRSVDAFPGTRGDVYDLVGPTADRGSAWAIGGADTSGLPTVWTSSDLATWSTLTLPTGSPDEHGPVQALASTKLGLVALGTLAVPDGDGHPASWVSADGVHWARIPGADGPFVLADGPAGVIGLSSSSDSDVPSVVWVLK